MMWWEADPLLKENYESTLAWFRGLGGTTEEDAHNFEARVSFIAGEAAGVAMRNRPAGSLPIDIQQAFIALFNAGRELEPAPLQSLGLTTIDWTLVLGNDFSELLHIAYRGMTGTSALTEPEWRTALARLGARTLIASGESFRAELEEAISGEQPST